MHLIFVYCWYWLRSFKTRSSLAIAFLLFSTVNVISVQSHISKLTTVTWIYLSHNIPITYGLCQYTQLAVVYQSILHDTVEQNKLAAGPLSGKLIILKINSQWFRFFAFNQLGKKNTKAGLAPSTRGVFPEKKNLTKYLFEILCSKVLNPKNDNTYILSQQNWGCA